ncbi:MAG: FliA/WhiG family RNA polymerase sigma factor [Deltaproteobacteria bacterium]|nr:FliA/WhiG family RNA polymerase sigma factor [Deltaproteobacteria bacterium]
MGATGTARQRVGVAASGRAVAARPAPAKVAVAATARGAALRAPAQPAPTRKAAVRVKALHAPVGAKAGKKGVAEALPSPKLRPFDEEEVRTYLPLVRQVVQRMLPRKPAEVAAEDLISWGTVGLLDAMRKYDCKREAAFPTYAQYRIRGSILDYLRRCDWLPRSARQKSHDIEDATIRLEHRLGRTPGADEIAAEMSMTLEQYAQAVATVGTAPMVPAGDVDFGRADEGCAAEDVVPDGGDAGPMRKVLRKERVEILAHAIEQLPDKERIVVSFYYFEGLTMREMADSLHLTEGRISQLHSQAMARLKVLLSDNEYDLSVD